MNNLETPKLPHEFVGSIADEAAQTLEDWLRAHAAPAAVLTLANEMRWLTMVESQARYTGKVFHYDNAAVLDALSETVNALVECGGVFHSSGSSSIPRTTGAG